MKVELEQVRYLNTLPIILLEILIALLLLPKSSEGLSCHKCYYSPNIEDGKLRGKIILEENTAGCLDPLKNKEDGNVTIQECPPESKTCSKFYFNGTFTTDKNPGPDSWHSFEMMVRNCSFEHAKADEIIPYKCTPLKDTKFRRVPGSATTWVGGKKPKPINMWSTVITNTMFNYYLLFEPFTVEWGANAPEHGDLTEADYQRVTITDGNACFCNDKDKCNESPGMKAFPRVKPGSMIRAAIAPESKQADSKGNSNQKFDKIIISLFFLHIYITWAWLRL